MKKIRLKVKGMHCKSCSMLIEDALEDLGAKSKVNDKEGIAVVEFDENKVSLAALKKAVTDEGYTVTKVE